jgi:hypothetical protein
LGLALIVDSNEFPTETTRQKQGNAFGSPDMIGRTEPKRVGLAEFTRLYLRSVEDKKTEPAPQPQDGEDKIATSVARALSKARTA